jgi:peptide/nickel transport system permease protein
MLPLVHFIAQRLAAALLTLAGAILLLIVTIQFVPGDLAGMLLGARTTPELRAQFAERMGLDRSIPEQIWLFFNRAVTGDLGADVVSDRNILSMIVEVLPNTLQLADAGLLISMLFGIVLGVHRGGWAPRSPSLPRRPSSSPFSCC